MERGGKGYADSENAMQVANGMPLGEVQMCSGVRAICLKSGFDASVNPLSAFGEDPAHGALQPRRVRHPE